MKYNTTQKKAILDILEQTNSVLNVAEILEVCKLKNLHISQSTIYRFVNELEQEQKIKKVEKSNKIGYIYIGECYFKHIHVLCEKCGEISHVDGNNIQVVGNIKIDLFKSNLSGICHKCEGGIE